MVHVDITPTLARRCTRRTIRLRALSGNTYWRMTHAFQQRRGRDGSDVGENGAARLRRVLRPTNDA